MQGMDENLERQHSTDAAAVQAPALLAAGEEGSRHGAKGLGMYAEAPALQLQIQKNREVAKQAAALAPVEELRNGLNQVHLADAACPGKVEAALCCPFDASDCTGVIPTRAASNVSLYVSLHRGIARRVQLFAQPAQQQS